MKKNLLFVHDYMNIGGVESALLAALKFLSGKGLDMTLLLLGTEGPLMDHVPEVVKIVAIPFTKLGEYRMKHGWKGALLYSLSHCHFLHAAKMLALKLWWAIAYRWRDVPFHYLESAQINSAFAYCGRVWGGDFVSRFYNDATTAIWFHNEAERFEYPRFRRITRRFDHAFACSKSLAEFFNKVLSRGDIHFETIPHIVDLEDYRKRAEQGEGLPTGQDGMLKILTVARLDYQKGIDMAIAAASRLKADGRSFVWYVVGGGEEMSSSKEMVHKLGLESEVVLLGARKNPFPCYRDCDIYVQPSRFEAYCLTIAEARAFSKPIVTTDTVGGSEQIKDGETGLVVPVEDAALLASGVGRLIDDAALRRRLSEKLAKENRSQIAEAQAAWLGLIGKDEASR